MRYTKEHMLEMTKEKQNNHKTVDKLVMEELLKMGFSYNRMGTHYLHESIVMSARMNLEDFGSVDKLCARIRERISKKYGIVAYQYSTEIAAVIERAFEVGDIEYLIHTFKGSYDCDKMKVGKNTFIMTVRKKIMDSLEGQEEYSIEQLRIIIQGTLEEITDRFLLEGLRNVVLSASSK